MSMTFGDLVDATNSVRREEPIDLVDGAGTHYTLEAAEGLVDGDGAPSALLLTIATV